ncbi:transcription initiation factor TFIID subunit 8-like [Saccostrea cucullata]|uniref:transcription initiation factor TFIID subunit 8-like n=1 Tax=Saccostrea cuccullata TaxID=36930 RepID=UPI002ED47FAA
MSLESDARAESCRKALKVAVSALASEVGFERAEEAAVETLTEMLQSFITEVGRSSQAFAELAGRTEGMMTDVVMALMEMGQNLSSLPAHAKRANKSVFLPPAHSTPTPNPRTLQAGDKMPHPSHIPEHMPAFPDPHTYIRTLTQKPPVNEYQIIREKAASQKRDVERALTRFIAKTGETQSLIRDDANLFPLIAIKPHPLPYLNALLPKDQDLLAQEEDTPTPKESSSSKSSQGGTKEGDTTEQEGDTPDPEAIDNPYLRPVKMAKYRKKTGVGMG